MQGVPFLGGLRLQWDYNILYEDYIHRGIHLWAGTFVGIIVIPLSEDCEVMCMNMHFMKQEST